MGIGLHGHGQLALVLADMLLFCLHLVSLVTELIHVAEEAATCTAINSHCLTMACSGQWCFFSMACLIPVRPSLCPGQVAVAFSGFDYIYIYISSSVCITWDLHK